MGWRTDFKNAMLDVLAEIAETGVVTGKYTQSPLETDSLVVTLNDEEYEHLPSQKVVRLNFEILGKVRELDDPDEVLDDLANEAIKKINGLAYYVFLDGTKLNPKTESEERTFQMTGYALFEKDFSDMES